ncbi:hypothetical protein HDV01_005682 [Terramyces sp. JEL0728]|nr:hypothetical protein HDV01_005682 [Terramyces sp. JEL0728]
MTITKTDRIEADIIQRAYIVGKSAPQLHYFRFKSLITNVFGKIKCFNSNISVSDCVTIKLDKQEYFKFGLVGKKDNGYTVTVKEINDRTRKILDDLGEAEFISFEYSSEFNMEKIPVTIKSYSLSNYVIIDLENHNEIVEWMGLVQIRADRLKKSDSVDPFVAIYEQPRGVVGNFQLFELEGYMSAGSFKIDCYCMNLIGEFSQIIYGSNVIKSTK